MTLLTSDEAIYDDNPLDVVEEIVAANQWRFERTGDEELTVSVAGSWCDYHLGFSYNTVCGGLQLACAFDMRVPERRRAPVHSLLALVNERMWLGHFDLWSEDAVPMYRHGVLIRGGGAPNFDQMEELIEIALSECERFYPAFQYVIWGGKDASEAIAVSMLDTMGEA
jgi:hypothetical protein